MTLNTKGAFPLPFTAPSTAPSTGLPGHLLRQPSQQRLAVRVDLLQGIQHCLGVDVRVVCVACQLLWESHDSHMIKQHHYLLQSHDSHMIKQHHYPLQSHDSHMIKQHHSRQSHDILRTL